MQPPRFLSACLLLALLLSCDRPPVEYDLDGTSFELVNQDSIGVDFPQDFSGKTVVAGFVFTHCPDVCPLITAKLGNIQRQLDDPAGVHFVILTFDPERDTPSVLKRYRERYRLDPLRFTMLTGRPATVDSLLSRIDFTARKTEPDSTHGTGYMMEHSNRILIMDGSSRVRFEYPGSAVPSGHVLEDLNRLR